MAVYPFLKRISHWQHEITDHAVVAVGIDHENGVIYIHDPAFPSGPVEMPLLNFELGWDEKERQYAIIRLTDLDET